MLCLGRCRDLPGFHSPSGRRVSSGQLLSVSPPDGLDTRKLSVSIWTGADTVDRRLRRA
jgi:hypothetical protein